MMKKNATLTSVIFSLIIVFALFTGMYLYLSWNATDSGETIDSKYGESYTNLTLQQTALDTVVDNIGDAINDITEPTSVFSVAFGSLKGLLNVVLLPGALVLTGVQTFYAVNNLIEIPSWASTLAILSITVVVIIIIIGLLKGEPKT